MPMKRNNGMNNLNITHSPGSDCWAVAVVAYTQLGPSLYMWSYNQCAKSYQNRIA